MPTDEIGVLGAASAKPGQPSRAHAYAWVTVLAAAVALYLVVVVAGSRAPSATPYLALAGGAAGAAVAGIALEAAERRVKVRLPLKLATIALAAVVLLFAAGGTRYTYGAAGDLAVTLEFSPPAVVYGTTASVSGNLTLFNVGSTIVRVNPHFELIVTNPQGAAVLRFSQGCIGRVAPPVEADLVELAPDGYIQSPFRLSFVWSAGAGPTAPCGAALLEGTGDFHIVGLASSGPFNAPGLVPVWAGEVNSEAKTLPVR